ncbi:MAG: rhomboid family intramembrane serine protease [Sphingomonadales bacterium]|nr:rhomboid family intramembrane serine protease [Sphingomonadales bacterium]
MLQVFSGPENAESMVREFGFVPASFFKSMEVETFRQANPWITPFTSMFLHGGWGHLLGNMVFLWVFGNNIEDDLGHVRFIIFYFLAGLAAALIQAFTDPSSAIPMVGASGAISGILGAYIILYPKARVETLVWLGILITTMRVPAFWFLGVWFAMQWFQVLTTGSEGAGVAFWAHIGGFMSGVALLYMLKPRKTSIFTGSSGRNIGKSRRSKRRRGPWG